MAKADETPPADCREQNAYTLGVDADGGLTIYMQKDLPGADKEANRLPALDGQFFMILRTYLPAEDIANRTWQPSKIAAVSQKEVGSN